MQEIHDPQWWIFSSRDCVGGLLDALVEHHGWDYQPKQFTYEETQQDPTYSKMTFWEWRYTKITYIAPQL